MIKIRPFEEKDRHSVRLLLAEIASLYPAGNEWLERRLGEAGAIIRVAFYESEMAGISIEMPKLRYLKLCTLSVREDLRGRGIGRALMDECRKYWQSHDISRNIVTVRLERSPMLMALLSHYDFRVIDTQVDRYGPGKTEVILQRWTPACETW